MSQTFAFLGLLLVWIAAIAWEYRKRTRNRLPLPPSLKPDPLIGHLRHIPSEDEPRVYRDWGTRLDSDIVSMSVMGQVIIVVNSLETATELLAKRSSIYSDRPELAMLNDERLVGWGSNTGNIRYGDNWRTQRRLTHSVLHKKASEDFWPVMIKQTRSALQRILDRPERFTHEFRRMSGSTLLYSVYGYEVTSDNDELVKVVESAVHKISKAALAGNFYVNAINWLKYIPSWFPGASWKRTANAWRREVDQMVHVPYDWAKRQIASGTEMPSVVRQMLTSRGSDDALDEDRIRWATATLFAAGTDTSVATVMVFVLAMVLHPDVQVRAQEEIDALLGHARLPEMTDRGSLPYVCCIVKEVLRWWPVFPLGVPHASTEDDVFRGYSIPKGATNRQHMPEKFWPERFLDPTLPFAPGFGFGRRSCPGIHFAESSLFITMCTLLMVFNMRPPKDEKGNNVFPEIRKEPNPLIRYVLSDLLHPPAGS
ncbi:cytochrome P450 family protein [Ceratobasidium sp. AG-Ba]|nr:cytochrome P450 family protein [Ceratobasidium sp. AG-Ba]